MDDDIVLAIVHHERVMPKMAVRSNLHQAARGNRRPIIDESILSNFDSARTVCSKLDRNDGSGETYTFSQRYFSAARYDAASAQSHRKGCLHLAPQPKLGVDNACVVSDLAGQRDHIKWL